MKVLAWLAFPLVATLLAMCWAAWRGRDRGPRRSGGAFASVEDFRRFNDALAAPGPSATPERRRGIGRRAAPQAIGESGAGTVRGAGSLDAAQTASARKAGTLGSTKNAGQGS
jgi:hypothetical protein